MRHPIACAVILVATAAAAADIEPVDGGSGEGAERVVSDSAQEDRAQPGSGIFEGPDAALDPDEIRFDFSSGVDLRGIDLADAAEGAALITLIDGAGLARTYEVDAGLARDIVASVPRGRETLDLNIRAGPHGEGGFSPGSNLPGVPPASAVRLEVRLTAASTRLDKLAFIPAPGSAFLAIMGATALIRRRR